MKEFEIFKLEDRVLFEAAAAAEIVEAASAAQYDPNAEVSESDRQAQQERNALKNAPPENPAAAADPANDSIENITDVDSEIDALIEGEIASELPKELVIINGSVADKDAIISDLQPNQEVLILENGTGLDEVNDFLAASDANYSAIHFITHGNEGYISLNGERIDAENFDAGAWQEIGEHLTEDGDILFYGCSTAADASGADLIDMISDASGADVAASDDVTGISGDWDLEYTVGSVETDEIAVENFRHNLTGFTVDTTDDVVDDTDGVTSLREAIEAANNNAGADEITFDSSLDGQVITLTDGALEITEALSIVGNGVNDTIIDGNNTDSIFKVSAWDDISLSLSGMTLQNGYAPDNGGAVDIFGFGNVDLELNGVTITACGADYGSGGAVSIHANEAVRLDIINSTIAGNAVQDDGGAVYLQAESFTVNVIDSTITGNTTEGLNSHSGAGLYLQHSENSSLNIVNSIVYGNSSVTSAPNPAADVYVDNQADTPVALNVVHSIYGEITDGSSNETFTPQNLTGSTQLEFSAENMTRVFGSAAPRVSDGVIQVNNQDIAGFSGTLAAKDANGNFIYFDHSGSWKTLDGADASAPAATDIIFDDQLGEHRALAKNYLGVNEFFVGAVAGKIYLKVSPQDATYKYDGSVKTAEVKYYTAKGTEIKTADLPSGTTIDSGNITTSSANADVYILNSVLTYISSNGSDVTGSFDLDSDSAKITITPRKVTLTSADDSKVYDGTALTNSTVTVGEDGFIRGEGAAFDVTGSQTDVGSSENTFTYLLDSNTLAQNYNIEVIYGTLTVEFGSVITITSDSASKIYDGKVLTAHGYQLSGGNVADGHRIEAEYTGEQLNAGKSDNTFTFKVLDQAGNDVTANYLFNAEKGVLEVSRRAVTVTAIAQQITYGDTMPQLTYSTENVVQGEILNGELQLTGTEYSSSGNLKAGIYEINAGSVTDDNNANYQITFETADFTVNKLALQLSIDAADKVYDGNTTAALNGATADNLISGDDLRLDVSNADADFADRNAGANKTVTVTGGLQLLGADAENYELVYDYTGTAEISRKPLDVSVYVTTNKIYDGTVTADNKAVINNLVGDDQVNIHSKWEYNDPDVADADTIFCTQWSISGEDAHNYVLTDAPAEMGGTITAKDVEIIYVTDAPYYYDSTDQSGTVSAYYTDIHGNQIDVPVNWGGQIFAPVGVYNVTITVSDTNYNPVNPSTVLVMNPNNPAGGIYLTGIEPVIPVIRGTLLTDPADMVYGDVYTMNYPELLQHSMLSYEDMELAPVSIRTATDILEYKPMTPDSPMRESTVLERPQVVNPQGFISGEEIFSTGSDAIIKVRGDAPVESPESLYIDGDSGAEDLPWHVVSDEVESVLPVIPEAAVIPEKLDGFKSDFEKLLEELVLA